MRDESLKRCIGDGFGPAHRPTRAGEQLGGHFGDLGIEFGGWHGVIDQPDFGGFRCLDQIARQQKFLGAGIADELRPDHRAAIAGHQPDLDMGIADHGIFIGDDDVTEQRDGRPQPGGRAVQPANDRLFDIEQRGDDTLGIPADIAKFLRVGDLFVEPGKIPAGTKGAASAGQDDEITIRIMLEIGEHPRQLVVHRPIDAIDRVIAGDRRREDAALASKGETAVPIKRHW